MVKMTARVAGSHFEERVSFGIFNSTSAVQRGNGSAFFPGQDSRNELSTVKVFIDLSERQVDR
jgi:hypothetical protein